MTGTIELDRDGHHLLISFPYREDLVEQVRTLPGRRWDRGSKMWKVPAKHAEAVIATFLPHGFEIAPEVSSILAGTATIAPKPTKEKPAPKAEADPDAPLTVSSLNERVRAALISAFPGRLHVVGEVSDFDKNQERKHIFFSLVEKAPGGQKVKATVEVALFERQVRRLLPALGEKGVEVRDGIEILVEARVDLYPASGRFQLIIEDIRPEFTLGKLALSREQILAELKERGLLETNLQKALPTPCLRIGVLASPDSDGWTDLYKQLESSGIGFELGLFPIRVQGPELKPTVLEGLTWFSKHAADWDCVCIIRGGGARTDLAWFDDREIALAVAQHPLKVVCGIGHDRDQSVLDVITHSEKTPTAVGAYLVREVAEAQSELQAAGRRLRESATARLADIHAGLTKLGHRLSRAVDARLMRDHQLLKDAMPRVQRAIRTRFSSERRDVERAEKRLVTAVRGPVRAGIERLATAASRVVRASRQRVERAKLGLDHAEARRRLVEPSRVLDRGFALVRDADGGIVKSVGAIAAGQLARVQLRDGTIDARVEKIDKHERNDD